MLAPRTSTTTATTWPPLSMAEPHAGAPIDANGNLTADGTRTFEWDARNQLLAVNVGTNRSEFTYDGEQRRVRVVEKENGVVQSDSKVVWCETGICEERAADGTTITGRPFFQGEQRNGNTRYSNSDHLGSITEVTDASAALLARYAFDPWGRRAVTNGSDVSTEGFTGHRWQATAQVWLAQYRAYDPALGRWISEDPSGYVDGPNLYGYVSGDPVLWADPDGLQRRRCPARVYAILRGAVVAFCYAPRSCGPGDSCRVLKLKMLTRQMCLNAQIALTKACYADNPTHRGRVEEERRGIKVCEDILRQKELRCECK